MFSKTAMATLFASVLLLSACGGNDADDSNNNDTNNISQSQENRAPQITVSSSNVYVGDALNIEPIAFDADGDNLTFSIKNAPGWITFDSSTGKISGTPAEDDVAINSGIVITVADSDERVDSEAFSINVLQPQEKEVIVEVEKEVIKPVGFTLQVPATVYAGETVNISPAVQGGDDYDISYLITNKPAWMTFDGATGELSGTPTEDNVGDYNGIYMTAKDPAFTFALPTFSFTVLEKAVGEFAFVDDFPAKTYVNEHFTYTPQLLNKPAADIAFSVKNLPEGFNFDIETGRICGTPESTGLYENIIIIANAGGNEIVLGPKSLQVIQEPNQSIEVNLSLLPSWLFDYHETIVLEEEGVLTIEIDESKLEHPEELSGICIRAEREGDYTLYTKALNRTDAEIYLKHLPELEQGFSMTILYEDGAYFCPMPMDEVKMELIHTETDKVYSVTTGEHGHLEIDDIPLGNYSICVVDERYIDQGGDSLREPCFTATNNVGRDNLTQRFSPRWEAEAPNIYLYPESETEVSVDVILPEGNWITESLPEYGNGWQVNIKPDGYIDDKYGYLFYEATTGMEMQYENGWLINGNDLEREFARILGYYGFKGREITDFNEFWVPVYSSAESKSNWFVIYPQDATEMSTLNINPQPDTLMRMLLIIQPVKQPIDIAEPEVTPLVRKGFTVVEWGVLNRFGFL